MSSVVSVADYQRVDDRELARAVRDAEPTCVNDLPDRQAIAAECDLSPKRVADRLRDLEARGHVAVHESLRLDIAGARNSYEVLTPSDEIDPDARTVESPRFEKQYSPADCRAALARAAEAADEPLSQEVYREVAREDDPAPRTIENRLGSWADARDAALGGDDA